ncbi:Bug family tripartite tricarboxylate transporter substrate binding protein [Pseudorhodoferax sp.]|uniref:Bug family tripartite tricarboxylate transporter substrate binding protein n=1 Tax=Pseudorhodoferax sp. TaxID=1993553 RepID=UPI002DD6B954|nr:tripartite tricarboxylate transporter substrate binding protein [Pseudorhodoferax sp.]
MKTWSTWLRAGALAVAAGAVGLGAAAEGGYPNKPIRLVVPYAAGGGLDGITRIVAQAMGEGLGQSLVVDNKAGGGGMIGAETVAKAAPDGYTLLMAGNPELVINPVLSPAVRYQVTRDFTPIMLVAESPNVLAAHPAVKGTLAELLDARGDAGPLTIGTPGQGSPQHLAIASLGSFAKASLVHVPYKGAGPAVVDALGGQTRLVLVGAPAVLPYTRSGKLRALAVTQPTRSSLAPDIPTVEEATGVKDLGQYTTWYGLLAPAGTPAATVQLLQKNIAAVLARPDIRAKLNEMGTEVVALPGAAFAERIKADLARNEQVIKRFNIRAE